MSPKSNPCVIGVGYDSENETNARISLEQMDSKLSEALKKLDMILAVLAAKFGDDFVGDVVDQNKRKAQSEGQPHGHGQGSSGTAQTNLSMSVRSWPHVNNVNRTTSKQTPDPEQSTQIQPDPLANSNEMDMEITFASIVIIPKSESDLKSEPEEPFDFSLDTDLVHPDAANVSENLPSFNTESQPPNTNINFNIPRILPNIPADAEPNNENDIQNQIVNFGHTVTENGRQSPVPPELDFEEHVVETNELSDLESRYQSHRPTPQVQSQCNDQLLAPTPNPNPKSLRKSSRRERNGCETCGKYFSNKVKLVEHLSIHTREKPFKCKVCGRFFPCSTSLRKHRLVHTHGKEEKPYKCDNFGHPKNFGPLAPVRKCSRKSAERKHYVCEICGNTYAFKNSLTKHYTDKHLNKKYECPECGKQFGRQNNRREHILRIHKGVDRKKKKASPSSAF